MRRLPAGAAAGLGAAAGQRLLGVDDTLLRWTNFHGDGSWGPHEFSEDPRLIRRCKEAFEAVRERAIDHAGHTPQRKEPAAA